MSNDGNVYDKAREVLRERGWTQGILRDLDGSVCLMGALSLAVDPNEHPRYRIARDALPLVAEIIREQFPHAVETHLTDITQIGCWNDEVASSSADVDLVLDKAARAWDEQHSGGTR